jgi:hypothetical protein
MKKARSSDESVASTATREASQPLRRDEFVTLLSSVTEVLGRFGIEVD